MGRGRKIRIMKSIIVLTLAATTLALGGCESMYVGGSVGGLADTGHRPGPVVTPEKPV